MVGTREQKRRTFTVDVQHLRPCSDTVASMDDGLYPSLRWKLYPPPLTVFTAKYLMGWASLSTLVPPAAPKKR